MIVRSSLEYTTQRQEISKELVAGHNFAEGLPKKSEIKESSALKVKTTVLKDAGEIKGRGPTNDKRVSFG